MKITNHNNLPTHLKQKSNLKDNQNFQAILSKNLHLFQHRPNSSILQKIIRHYL